MSEKIRRLKTRTFAKLHGVRKEHVIRSAGANIPWFGHIDIYIDWLRERMKDTKS